MDERRDTKCLTVLIDDSPALEDAFAASGVLGSHDRVAQAIVELTAEAGGKMIGLEGGWGIGKTTVVNLINKHLGSDVKRQVVMFDAWAHEGDPLRRTFLESLIQQLDQLNWLDDPESWHKTRDALAKRRRESKQRTIPKPTTLGKLVAFSLLFVPVGPAFIAAALRQGITVSWGGPPAWKLWIGLFCTFAPVSAVVLRWTWLRFGFFDKWLGPLVFWIWRLIIPDRLRVKSDAGQEEGADKQGRNKEEISQFALLLSHSITETETQITEEPEPTSIEFERYFCKLMGESLRDKSRKLLLVLDNLDRVAPKDALAIWSTLQTFLQTNGLHAMEWSEQLWVLVPYDPSGLRRLWSTKGADPNDTATDTVGGVDNDASVAPSIRSRVPIVQQSFLDKSFQVRFEVPPPVLSNWRQFLCDLVEIALPDHPAEDRQKLYQVFNLFRGDRRTPTPRELKLYVNQIGALHRQWQDEFDIAHLAPKQACTERFVGRRPGDAWERILSGPGRLRPESLGRVVVAVIAA